GSFNAELAMKFFPAFQSSLELSPAGVGPKINAAAQASCSRFIGKNAYGLGKWAPTAANPWPLNGGEEATTNRPLAKALAQALTHGLFDPKIPGITSPTLRDQAIPLFGTCTG